MLLLLGDLPLEQNPLLVLTEQVTLVLPKAAVQAVRVPTRLRGGRYQSGRGCDVLGTADLQRQTFECNVKHCDFELNFQ